MPTRKASDDADAAALGDRPVVRLAAAGPVHQAGGDHQPHGGGGNRASPAAKVRWRSSAARVMEAWGAKEERGEKMELEVRGEKQATEVRGETDTPSP